MICMEPEHYATFKASGRLPSPKGVGLAILRLLRSDDYKLNDVVQLLQSDPAMAGRLLRFANAAAFGNPRPVVAIPKAVKLLGSHRVRDLVLGFSILQDFRNIKCGDFDFETFWSRSLATAIAAQVLAKHAQIAAEESFTLGLLCDIGILALAAYDPARYADVQQRVESRGETVLDAERALFSTDHRQLGATMMAEWGLPEALSSAALHCEAPDSSGLVDGSRRYMLTLTLHFARALANICVAHAPARWGLLPEVYAKAARLGIEPDELAILADDLVCRWNEWGATLKLHTQQLPPFAELLASAPPNGAETASTRNRGAAIIGADPATAGDLAEILEELGYTVNQFGNGIEGLKATMHDPPELLIVALDSPQLDGKAFCRAFRRDPQASESHLILLGAREHEDRLIDAVDAGGDDYLVLPVSAAQLRVRLRGVDKVAHLHEEIRRERRSLIRSAGDWAGSQRRMMDVALSDPLTRLPNRRYGLDFLAAEWALARADSRALACLMLDIDHFKRVNDTHGHAAGDLVLAGVAKILAGLCRKEDMVFRYGGEEFCILCPGTDLRVAGEVAERIRRAIGMGVFAYGERKLTVTVSIGIAALSPAHTDADALMKDADRALYRAKQKGRDRVERCSP